jgi:hypothetical protein
MSSNGRYLRGMPTVELWLRDHSEFVETKRNIAMVSLLLCRGRQEDVGL